MAVMSQRPMAMGLLLCEQLIIEEVTKNHLLPFLSPLFPPQSMFGCEQTAMLGGIRF
jgi:hypothetical protein